MKVRVLAVLFALCVLFAGCAPGNSNAGEGTSKPQVSSYEVINAALENNEKLDSMNMEMQMDISISMEGQTIDVPMTVTCKAKNVTSDSPIVQTHIATSVLGQKSNVDMYQEGTWAYITTQGQSFKTDISEENPYDQLGSSQDIMMDLPEELLKDFPMTQNSDGSQTVTITIPNETFESIYGDLLESINSTSSAGTATSVSVKDATVKITVKQGYVVEYSMNFEMDMTVSGYDASSRVTASVKFIDPGQDVIITPPAGYQSYPVMS